MTQRLTEMEITRVSLVDKGANARVMAILKRNEEGSMTDQAEAAERASAAGWLQKAADWLLGKPEPVAKARTFAEIVAGQELQDALRDNWYTLEDALWSAIYAVDDDGQDLSMEAKQALVARNLDEFKTYLMDQMASVVSKAAPGPVELAKRRVDMAVAKVGKKISGSRLERLQSAAASLTSVLDEVAEVVEEAAGTAEEVPVDKAELTAAFTEAIEPIVKRLDALEATKVEKTETVGEGGPEGAGDGDELTLEGIAKAVDAIADSVAELKASQGVRKSLAGQDGSDEPVKKGGTFAGILS
jgi:hypothetical protein